MAKNFHFRNSETIESGDDLLQLQKFALKSTDEPKNEIDTGFTMVKAIAPVSEFEKDNQEGKNSFFEKSMVVTGSVSSVTCTEVDGKVNGNVSCESDVIVSGYVTGDITAKNVQIHSGQVKGNIDSRNSVVLNKDSVVNGNISGETINCDGKIDGNIKVKIKAVITANAVIIGDICACKISIEEGAVIKGKLLVSEETADGKNTPQPDANSAV